jgi:hypothetical protein
METEGVVKGVTKNINHPMEREDLEEMLKRRKTNETLKENNFH